MNDRDPPTIPYATPAPGARRMPLWIPLLVAVLLVAFAAAFLMLGVRGTVPVAPVAPVPGGGMVPTPVPATLPAE